MNTITDNIVYFVDLQDELKLTYEGVKYRAKESLCRVFRHKSLLAVSKDDARIIKGFVNNPKSVAVNGEWVDDFLEEVKSEANKMKITFKEIALESGMSAPMVSLLLNGKRTMTLLYAEKLAKAVGMKPVLCLMEVEE